jgi:membrane associated rhomboid family serine protease
VLVFLGQFWISGNNPDIGKSLVYMYGFVPAEFNPLTIFTSMFMHGGFAHIIGNMWFLYIFGDNVESILGHVKFFMFYLACGIGAALAQFFVEPASQVPMIGASGAVAGVLGAYMIRFPKARVHVLAVIIIFITTFVVPAQIVLGLWFLMQLSGGLGSLGVDTTGGVAWFAHIGGFIIGVTSLKYFQNFRIE